MFVVPVNPNVIHVPMVTTGCWKSEFDSTYPVHLNGIIREDEFRESIYNINRTTSSRISKIICGIIFISCIAGAMILIIAGEITYGNSRPNGFYVLIGLGLGLIFVGILLVSVGYYCIRIRRTNRMREAIANESIKYSRRSPIPCSWRLHVTRFWTGGYRGGRGNTQYVYRLEIEIGNTGGPIGGSTPYQFNQFAPQSTSFFPQQNNIPPPPAYYGQTTPGFCSRCGMQRQNPTMKFCSSCGQPFGV